MLFKRDVMPGNIRNVFEVSRLEGEGAYVGRCAELCGSYHAFMNFELRVVSPEKFDRFLAAKQDGSLDPGRADRHRRGAVRGDDAAVRDAAYRAQLQPGQRCGRRGKLRQRA